MPLALNVLVAAAKTAWGLYQANEAKLAGHTPEQLKQRIDAADELIRRNFAIIEQMSDDLAARDEQLERLVERVDRLQARLVWAYAGAACALLFAIALRIW